MPLDAALKKIDAADYSGAKYVADNTNDPVTRAAVGLIRAYKVTSHLNQEKPGVLVKAFGRPDEARHRVAKELKLLGNAYDIDALCLNALEQYVEENGDLPANVSKVIASAQILDRLPDPQFKSGHRVVLAINEQGSDFVGASEAGMAFGPNGTCTSSKQGKIDERFGAITKQTLWITIDFPEKSELEGMEAEQQAALTVIAEAIADPANAAQNFDAIIEQIQELGTSTDIDVAATIELVANAVEVASMIASNPALADSAPVQQSLERIIAQLETDSNIPAGIVETIQATVAALTEAQPANAPIAIETPSVAIAEIVPFASGDMTQSVPENVAEGIDVIADVKPQDVSISIDMTSEITPHSAEAAVLSQQNQDIAVSAETTAAPTAQIVETGTPTEISTHNGTMPASAEIMISVQDAAITSELALTNNPEKGKDITPESLSVNEISIASVEPLTSAQDTAAVASENQNTVTESHFDHIEAPQTVLAEQAIQTTATDIVVASPETHIAELENIATNMDASTPHAALTEQIALITAKPAEAVADIATMKTDALVMEQGHAISTASVMTQATFTHNAAHAQRATSSHGQIPALGTLTAKTAFGGQAAATSYNAAPLTSQIIHNVAQKDVTSHQNNHTTAHITPVVTPANNNVISVTSAKNTSTPLGEKNTVTPAAAVTQLLVTAKLPTVLENPESRKTIERAIQIIEQGGTLPKAEQKEIQKIIEKMPQGQERQQLQKINRDYAQSSTPALVIQPSQKIAIDKIMTTMEKSLPNTPKNEEIRATLKEISATGTITAAQIEIVREAAKTTPELVRVIPETNLTLNDFMPAKIAEIDTSTIDFSAPCGKKGGCATGCSCPFMAVASGEKAYVEAAVTHDKQVNTKLFASLDLDNF